MLGRTVERDIQTTKVRSEVRWLMRTFSNHHYDDQKPESLPITLSTVFSATLVIKVLSWPNAHNIRSSQNF